MNETVQNVNIVDFAVMLKMMELLVRKGEITKRQMDITAQRIAEEFELSPLYL